MSDAKKGLFCKYCPWFVTRHEDDCQKNVPLGVLVRSPLTNFKKLTADLESHSSNKYHKDAVQKGKDFLKNYCEPRLEIMNQIDRAHLMEAEENQKQFVPIVKTIMLSGRQNIALVVIEMMACFLFKNWAVIRMKAILGNYFDSKLTQETRSSKVISKMIHQETCISATRPFRIRSSSGVDWRFMIKF